LLLDYRSLFESIATTPSAWTECSLSTMAWTELDATPVGAEETGEYVMMGGAVLPVLEEVETWVEPDVPNITWTEVQV